MKFETVKSIFLGVLALVIVCCAWVGAKEIMNHFALKNKLINEEMVILKKNVVSQQAQINTKLLESKFKEFDLSIKALIKERDQEVTDIGKTVAKIKQTRDLKDRGSDHVYKGKDEKQDQYFKKIYAKDTEGNKYPIAWVICYPNQTEDKMWKSGTYPLEINQRIALAENDVRTDSYVEMWLENNQMKETKGQKFPLEITHVEWVKRAPKEKSWMWNPRLALSISAGTELYPSIDMSLFSYGRTKGDMDWRFLDFGVGGDSDNFYLQFAPVEYNIGKPLPLAENLFISPYINITPESLYGYGIKSSLPF